MVSEAVRQANITSITINKQKGEEKNQTSIRKWKLGLLILKLISGKGSTNQTIPKCLEKNKETTVDFTVFMLSNYFVSAPLFAFLQLLFTFSSQSSYKSLSKCLESRQDVMLLIETPSARSQWDYFSLGVQSHATSAPFGTGHSAASFYQCFIFHKRLSFLQLC